VYVWSVVFVSLPTCGVCMLLLLLTLSPRDSGPVASIVQVGAVAKSLK